MADFTTIQFTLDGGIARLTLNRPDKLNSFNTAMHAEVRAALDEVEAPRSAVRVLLITGAGRAFCAGQDLGDRAVAPGARQDLGLSIEEHYAPLVRRLQALPLPVVCAVNGIAAGAGCNLALACDLTLAAASAAFYQPFCKLGLVPDTGGTYFLPHRVGTQRALGMALLGDKIPAEQAAAWGLIWKSFPDAEFAPAVEALVQQLAQGPTRGLAATKHAIYAAARHSLDQQLDLEHDLQRELGNSEDYREGVAAFLEKRAPRFTGR